MEDMIGNTIERLLADAGYRGHNAPPDYKFRVYVGPETPARAADQTRAAAARRHRTSNRSSQGRAPHGPQLSCTHAGDAVNAVLATAGYNFHLLLSWLELLLSRFLAAQNAAAVLQSV
jgi:IS5 family transposase